MAGSLLDLARTTALLFSGAAGATRLADFQGIRAMLRMSQLRKSSQTARHPFALILQPAQLSVTSDRRPVI
jgi:hypothetical protein